MEQGGQKMALPAELGDSFLDFNSDGTVLLIDSDKEEKGKWSYDHKTKVLTATNGEKEIQKFEVTKVTETELVMKVTGEGMTMNMYLKRVK